MTYDPRRRLSAASVHQRILNEARKSGVSHELFMRRYVFERFLLRLGQSEFRDKLILKGAMALVAVTRNFTRATRDMDMLGVVKFTSAQALEAVRTIAAIEPEDGDPVVFDLAKFKVSVINAAQEEPGHQITGEARIGNARIPLKLEISHGEVISPRPVAMKYPTVLEECLAPDILCYTPQSMLAEKFEAVVSLGTGNSRFKDFFDIRDMARRVDFEGPSLSEAFKATFGNRDTPIPETAPVAFLPEFSEAGERGWRAFLTRQAQPDDQSFAELVAEIEPFVMRICGMASGREQQRDWTAGSWAATAKPLAPQ